MRRLLITAGLSLVACAVPAHLTDHTPEHPAEAAIRTVNAVLLQRMPNLDETRRQQLAGVIVTESVAGDFDPLLILALIEVESGFNMEAISPTGALGLMQIIPATWKWVVKEENLGYQERFNPVHNARVGIRYLRSLSKRFKRLDAILYAYNQGPGAAKRVLQKREEPTDEGKSFAPSVIRSYKRFLTGHGFSAFAYLELSRSPKRTLLRRAEPVILLASR